MEKVAQHLHLALNVVNYSKWAVHAKQAKKMKSWDFPFVYFNSFIMWTSLLHKNIEIFFFFLNIVPMWEKKLPDF